MPSELASVIITNWNGRAHLERCLPGLASQSYRPLEVILVDNGSTDGSTEWVARNFPDVRIIRNAENLGFATANNQGINEARGDYVVLLNNDTWAEPDWLLHLVQAVRTDAGIGMVASKMLYADQPEVINSAGICVDRCGITWERRTGERDNPREAELQEVFGPSAGAGLYRRTMLDEVGLFDDDFFIYLEDVDLAWRARWLGWRAVFAPQARVFHVHSATMEEGSPRKTRLLAQNKISLLLRNYPWPYGLWYLPLIMFYELLSLGHAVWNGRGVSAVMGRLAGARRIPRSLAQRRRTQRQARVPARSALDWLEPVRWPWQVAGQVRHIGAGKS
jgi:hypothetical protein